MTHHKFYEIQIYRELLRRLHKIDTDCFVIIDSLSGNALLNIVLLLM